MSLLRRTRAEVAGAWRSVRYDMGRRPVEPPAGGPDVTSTGMSTFGGRSFTEFEEPRAGRPRRAAAVTALGMLTVLGAAGAYLGVVNGLGSLLHESQAEAGTVPPRPPVTSTFTPNAGIGRGPAMGTPTTADGTTEMPGPAATEPPPSATARNMSPIRTAKATNPICPCGHPPVPTPTAPASAPSPTPSAGPYPSSSSEPDPDETSATPSTSAEPNDSPQARHRRRHR
jgi:hypothetical protein